MKKSLILLCLCIVLIGSVVCAGGEALSPEALKEQYPETWQSVYESGKEAGMAEAQAQAQPAPAWWEHSSRTEAGAAERLKTHLEVDYSYVRLEGNDDGDIHKGSATAILRRGYLTNTTRYTIERVEIEQTSGGQIETDAQFFENSLQWDFTRRLYGQVGYIWERDLSSYVKDRHIGYAGGGATVLQAGPFQVELYLAGGYQDESYYPIIRQFIGIKGETTPIVYAYQSVFWQVTDRLSFSQKWRGIYDIEQSGQYEEVLTATGPAYPKVDEENRLRQRLRLELAYAVTPVVSVFTSMQLEHDTTPWPGVEKEDIKYANGLRLTF